jgi:hypothetical protein
VLPHGAQGTVPARVAVTLASVRQQERSSEHPWPRYGFAAMALALFAGVPVSDYAVARSWYERLLGRKPSFLPHATEAVWELAEHRSLYIVEDSGRAGRAVVTIFVDELEALVAAIASRGLEPDERVTYSSGASKAIYRDADGNEIGFGGVAA